MRAPPKFSMKVVHAAAWGSLLVSRWSRSHLEPETATLVVGAAECKLIKNITSLLFLSAERGRRPRGRHRTCECLS